MSAAERFEGRFENINTSYPVLFASGAFDPITPLSGAWRAASAFKGSRLLVHKGHGVCVFHFLSFFLSVVFSDRRGMVMLIF